MSILTSAPFPTFTLLLGCLTGFASSRQMSDGAVQLAAAPTAAAAMVETRGAGPIEEDAPSGLSGKTIYRSADGLFYVTARVNGRPIRFLVDTGASVMVLRAADAAAVGAPAGRARAGARIEGVGGSSAMSWTHLDSVAVAGHEVADVRAAVATRGLPVSLLGANLLARLGTLRIEGERLELE